MSTKGMTFNLSMVDNNGDYELGMKCNTTDGFDFDYNIAGDDLEEMFKECLEDFSEDVMDYLLDQEEEEDIEEEEEDQEFSTEHIRELEKIIADLTKENNALKTNNEVLQKRVDDAINKPKKEDIFARRRIFEDELNEMLKHFF